MWVLSMLGALAGGIGLFVAGGRANKDAARRAAEKLVAVEERLEMDREATDAERLARDLPDEAARREAMRWSKR
ncbi:MAG: hypothetical protein EOS18_24075 [Mesorhizobium sp.]|nr:MAG: hypothetical protein EOS18_24075 [Mesorhizobium sp.]